MSVGAVPFWLVLAWAASAVGQTLPRGYEIVQVTSNSRREFLPRMNNHGQVVFTAWPGGSRETQEIFLYDSRTGELTQLTNDNVQDIWPDINDEGTIVWSRGLGPWDPLNDVFTHEIMMRTPDGVVTRLTDNAEHEIQPSINSFGNVVWHRDGDWVCGGSVKDIYMFDGETVFPITNNGWAEQVENQAPEINDLGQIVWTEYDFCNPPPPYWFESRIMMYSDGVTQEISTGQFQPQLPVINNDGTVAWGARDAGTYVIDLLENGEVRRLGSGTNPKINNSGDLYFLRWHETTSTWQSWLRRNEVYLQITNDPFWNTDGDINDLGEVTWQSGDVPTSDIRVMRRMPLGDLNCDGDVDAFDIEPFIIALLDRQRYLMLYPSCDPLLGDLNEDGVLDAFDIEPFTGLLVP
jgi:hypothetical protein